MLGEHEDRTKTSTARTVSLNSRSRQALQAMKAHSLMSSKDGFIFLDPRTGERFTDDEPPREMYWRPALRRLGIRYRSPYETRHTYATIMLMSGVTPAFAAKQMGHTIQMFLTTYAKWIDGGQNAVEMGKLEGAIANSPLALPQESENSSKPLITRKNSGLPGGTRTPDLLLRRQLLYPVELRADRHISA